MNPEPSTKAPASPNREQPSAPASRRLGVTSCEACGQPTEVVGTLRPDGMCNVCGHGLDAQGILAAELRRFIQPWLVACKERDIPREAIAAAWGELGATQ